MEPKSFDNGDDNGELKYLTRFGVTRRSSNRDDNGEVKYLTLCCSRHGKTKSNSRNMLKPNLGSIITIWKFIGNSYAANSRKIYKYVASSSAKLRPSVQFCGFTLSGNWEDR